ncbi:glycosyltransferase family 2 protein [Geofilum rhodophaeum]|uniref:glycosyltransferase family 2 protein n=1 Tax=Geofilum rhodophaeum TaxID=1965019 RepID=UPI000B52722A|nr:glycosyltransferase family 2 protein [Geofilum rhodophaeum]
MSNTCISIVVPLYRCDKAVEELTDRISTTLGAQKLSFEIIYVNDASPSADWEAVTQIAQENTRVKGLSLSRNFGQHYAITAGLNYASGNWVVVMDGDLQDQPEDIPLLYNKAQEGFDIVLARRVERQHSFLKRIGSKWFYKTLAYLTDTEQNAEIANFGIYRKNVIAAILSMKDKTRYFPTMVRWVGFKRTEIGVNHAARKEGKSSYNLKALLNLALNTILSFSDKPLRLTVKAGIFISSAAFIFAAVTFIRALTGHIVVSGYSSMIISIWLLSGVIITLIGMLGLYIGKIFDQVKDRPTYLVAEKINFE